MNHKYDREFLNQRIINLARHAGSVPAAGPERSVNEMNTWPVIDMAATGQNIARLRRSAGLTVRDLQNVFGFANPQAIYRWQRGEAMPTVDNLVVLAAVFGVTVDDILVCAQQPRLRISA